jgi:hypothetical protein
MAKVQSLLKWENDLGINFKPSSFLKNRPQEPIHAALRTVYIQRLKLRRKCKKIKRNAELRIKKWRL